MPPAAHGHSNFAPLRFRYFRFAFRRDGESFTDLPGRFPGYLAGGNDGALFLIFWRQ